MTNVFVERARRAVYPNQCPYSPDEPYPEYALGDVAPEPNEVYRAVRRCLRSAASRLGLSPDNPLKRWIRPGQTVILKPNMVKERHPRDPNGWTYVLTHGSVIRAVADYVFLALEGQGKVIVADAPQTDSSFDKAKRLLGLDELADFYRSRGLSFESRDLRKQQWDARDGVVFRRRELRGDPEGYVACDLGDRSEFVGHGGEGRYYGADYDTVEVNKHHSGGRHEYLLSATSLNADVFFNLPKLKTHKLAGITCSLKNLVGINGDKNWLPHHTQGTPQNGGDAYPVESLRSRTEHSAISVLRRLALKVPAAGPAALWTLKKLAVPLLGETDKVSRGGNWYGNDTAWRMCLDLNKILLYGNADGTLRADRRESRKTYLSLCDGIVGGQGGGPANPDPVESSLIVFGDDPAAVDAACAVLMGLDPERIPTVRQAFLCKHFPITDVCWRDVRCCSSEPEWNRTLDNMDPGNVPRFEPHFGWRGHIERDREK